MVKLVSVVCRLFSSADDWNSIHLYRVGKGIIWIPSQMVAVTTLYLEIEFLSRRLDNRPCSNSMDACSARNNRFIGA